MTEGVADKLEVVDVADHHGKGLHLAGFDLAVDPLLPLTVCMLVLHADAGVDRKRPGAETGIIRNQFRFEEFMFIFLFRNVLSLE